MKTQKITIIKKILIVALLSICTSQSFAQSSNGIFFQAVARDNFSNPAKDRNIYVQSTIIQNTTTGTKVLIEIHKSSTDAMGVFNITIGNGQRTGGAATSIAAIDWSKGPFYLNLKIAITPFSASDSWDYSKELVDMGTTSFGAVPFAFYSASSAKIDDKLNANDTTKMLAVYAKAMSVKTLETSLATKLTAADTLTMLAPYAKAAYTIDSNFFRTQLATKLSIADSAKYVTTTQLASYNFSSGGGGVTVDTSNLSNRINLKANATELTSLTSSLGNKINIADSTTKYVTPTQLSRYNFSSGGTTITIDTTSLSNRINLKANVLDMNSAIASEAAVARTAELALSNNIASNTTNIATNTTAIGSLNTSVASNTSNIATNNSAIAAEATTARAAELTLTNNLASSTASITANTSSINSLNTNIASNTISITSLSSFVLGQVATSSSSELTITNNLSANTAAINSLNTNVESNTKSITANTNAIASEATTARAAELTLTNNVASNTSSITSNTTSINNLNTNVVSNISSINSLNTTIAAATNSNTANTIVKRDASGNFSAGTINASTINTPIYASTPQALTDGAIISWNPANGLNASVTLAGNRTLSFTSTPVAGSYGTLVVTQDATGGRTITLPSTTNKVLGSTSGTTIALSTTANANDILNFYYDGTNCYWNIGQGYGSAATAPLTLTTTGTGAATLSGTTLNIPSVSSTVNAGSISGTIAVANGGTGASTQQASINALTGTQSSGKYLRSDGTNATLTSIQAADIPTLNQNTTGNAATATLATNATTAGNITATSNGTLISLSSLNTVGTITSGTISVTTDIKTSGILTAGTVTYPKIHGTSGQVLSTTGSGTLTWTTTAAQGVPYSGATGAVNLGGYDLTVNGVTVGRGNLKMTNNYAFGYAVLSANTTGNYNNAFGHQALTANTTGTENNAFGEYVLPKNIGGSQNTAVGSNALKENTTGNGNTGYGRQALIANTTGSYNTAIGHQADVASNNLTNATAIGNGASVSTSNTIQLGNTSVTNVKTSGTITAKDVTYPNAHNATAGQVLTINATGTASWATPSSGGTGSGHYVGEVYGGGIVFYVTTGGYHGLIASSTDIMTSPITAIDRATSPDYHGYTTNGENLYIDWEAPTFSQLKLLRAARNTPGLNLNLSSNVSYISTTTDSGDTFKFTCLRFVDNVIEYPNGNWTNDGRLVLRSIRTF
jgi:hypothetical protein